MSDNKDYFLSWEELHQDTKQLASQLIEHGYHQQCSTIVGIARGGFIPAAILARELDHRLMDVLCISSYQHNRQEELDVLKSLEGDGEGYIIVDDLVDTGNTARVAREILPKAIFACVYAKPAGKPFTDFYSREFDQDVWLHFPWDSEAEEGQRKYSPPLAMKK